MKDKQVNKHYVGMAGLMGYLPQTCNSYDSLNAAVEGLADIHELGRDRKRILKRDMFLSLNLKRDGNEYCEITECFCSNPEVHDDC